MTNLQKQDTLAMARRVLAEEDPGRLRQAWANDVVAALTLGDPAAAARVYITLVESPAGEMRKAA